MFNCKTSGKSSLLTEEAALQWDSAVVELCRRKTWPWGCAPEGLPSKRQTCWAGKAPRGLHWCAKVQDTPFRILPYLSDFLCCSFTYPLFEPRHWNKVSSLSYNAKHKENKNSQFPLQIPHLISAMLCMLTTFCFPEQNGRWYQTRWHTWVCSARIVTLPMQTVVAVPEWSGLLLFYRPLPSHSH